MFEWLYNFVVYVISALMELFGVKKAVHFSDGSKPGTDAQDVSTASNAVDVVNANAVAKLEE